ncbi:uncharacterized protein METZ01_LOCUS344906, partial [marine metagenome]
MALVFLWKWVLVEDKKGKQKHKVFNSENDLADEPDSRDDLELEIIQNFGACMEKYDYLMSFIDVSALPHGKDKIHDALLAVYRRTNDSQQREVLK